MRKTGPTNIHLRLLISYLRKSSRRYGAPIWRYVSELLSRPRRRRVVVNLSKISRVASKGDIILVPGKVLGGGELRYPVTIVAWKVSKNAKEKIEKAGGTILSFEELLSKNPRGSNVKVIV
ncbi:MAG TPA: 50S ribosomal protein L18e [Thermoproteales archaeon]|nr:50S ribosomal protein L18e [Thermoproteales archaeon]